MSRTVRWADSAGVIGAVFVHGTLAYLLIDGGALALVAATLWNMRARVAQRPLVPTVATHDTLGPNV